MFSKVLLVTLWVVCCYGQQRLSVVTKRYGQESGVRILPSGPVKQFVSYPNVRRGSIEDALAIAGPYLRNAPVYAPTAAQLENVATYGLTNGLTGGIALGAKAQVLGPVIAAIITQRTAEVIDVPTPADIITPQVLIVEPNLLPVTIEFRSQSSPVNINQVHIPGPPGEVKQTRSEEEPDRVLHEVVKPVIQEVREIIQPFRKITQEILPVQEEVHSVVARGENKKVLQEYAIPDPVPVQLNSVAAPYAIEAPAVSNVVVRRQEVVEPVITSLGEPYSLRGTVVRAGLIGGSRVFEAPEAASSPKEDIEPVPAESLQKRSGRKINSNGDGQDVSINNRGPARPSKRA